MHSTGPKNHHTTHTALKNAHFHLRALRHIRSSLSTDMATSIAVALVQSRLDYANSLLNRVSTRNIHKLQRCQNTAARLTLQQSFTPSIQDLMNQLHWLPIQARIDFKIATLTYKVLSSGQPAYLRELISPYKPSRQLDLRVAAVQKHDPTWGWNRPQVDRRRLSHIRLDLTSLDSGMWLEST